MIIRRFYKIGSHMDKLKIDLKAFDKIADFPYSPNFVEYKNLRMHYIDEGEGQTILTLHGQPTWSYLYRSFIPVLKDFRIIAPDFIGFGKSDKLVNWEDYSFDLHLDSLIHFIKKLNLKDINLVVHEWGGLLGLSALGKFPDLFKSIIVLNTYLPDGQPLPLGYRIWRKIAKHHPSLPVGQFIKMFSYNKIPRSTIQAYKIPFRDKTYKTGVRSFPLLIPRDNDDHGMRHLKKAKEVLSNWNKPALVIFSDQDKIFSGHHTFFRKLIPSCSNQPIINIPNVGHFLQEEQGTNIANYIKMFLENRLGQKI